jgi:hypothetical protein
MSPEPKKIKGQKKKSEKQRHNDDDESSFEHVPSPKKRKSGSVEVLPQKQIRRIVWLKFLFFLSKL